MNEQLDMVVWMERWNKGNFSETEKYEMLKHLFKLQLKRLERLGCDFIVVEKGSDIDGLDPRSIYRLSKMQHKVINMAMGISKPGFIPFLPIIPRKVINTFHMIMKLYDSGENWYPSINFNKVDMGSETSPHKAPYFIFNIDQGFSTIGLSPQDSRIKIGSNGFHAMNLAEALAYQMHIGILNKSSVYACGSTYRENKKCVPNLFVNSQNSFELGWNSIDKSISGFVSPSYQVDMVAICWRIFISAKAWIKWKKRSKKQRVITPLKAD